MCLQFHQLSSLPQKKDQKSLQATLQNLKKLQQNQTSIKSATITQKNWNPEVTGFWKIINSMGCTCSIVSEHRDNNYFIITA